MTYKQKEYKELENKFSEKVKDYPIFIQNYFQKFKSAKTKNSYLSYLNNFLEWLLETNRINQNSIEKITIEDVAEIKSYDVIAYLRYLSQRQKMSTVNLKKNVLSSFWEYSRKNYSKVTENIIEDIPQNLFQEEKSNIKKSVKLPTDEQMKSLLRNVNIKDNQKQKPKFKDLRNAAIVYLFADCGLRLNELIGLDLQDIDLENREVKVMGKGKLQVKDKVEILPLLRNDPKIMNTLQNYIEARKEREVDTNALFISNQNGRLKETAITKMVDTRSDGTVTPHMLRHWTGTKYYEKSKDIVRVQNQMRHESTKTTVDYYVHL